MKGHAYDTVPVDRDGIPVDCYQDETLAGWRPGCECGWLGPWLRAATAGERFAPDQVLERGSVLHEVFHVFDVIVAGYVEPRLATSVTAVSQ